MFLNLGGEGIGNGASVSIGEKYTFSDKGVEFIVGDVTEWEDR